jgi:hypothetical protein
MKARSRLALFAAGAALLGGGALAVSTAASKPVAPPDLSSELAAFRDVCVSPASHGEIRRKARATGWEAMAPNDAPPLLAGIGASDIQEIRLGEIAGRPAMLMVSDLAGTSECRIYFQPADPAATIAQLKAEPVLGAPLGEPDFDDMMNYPKGWKAIGWHRSAAKDWRAVHYSFDPDGQGPNAGWQAIEITRKI